MLCRTLLEIGTFHQKPITSNENARSGADLTICKHKVLQAFFILYIN